MTATLVLLRHGESEWNAKNLFTGWVDVDLTDEGPRPRPPAAASCCAEAGLLPDVRAHLGAAPGDHDRATSPSTRADRHWIPVRRSWRLNERHYGALQGKDKKATLEEYGEEQFMLWRRSYDTPPPPIADDDEWSQAGDPRYADLPTRSCRAPSASATSSTRMLPYWYDAIVPDLRAGRTVLRRRARQLAARAGQAPRRDVATTTSSGSTSRPASRCVYELDERPAAGDRGRAVPRPGRRRRGDRGRQEPGPLARRWPTTATSSSRSTSPGCPGSGRRCRCRSPSWRPGREAAMSPAMWSYVAGGAGDEHTQRPTSTAFDHWGLMPRMFVGAAERDLSVELFGHDAAVPAAAWRRSA